MKRSLLLAALALLPAAGPADPDWPCVQRFVPTLTAATLWPGPQPIGDWRAEPARAALVRDTARRATPVDQAVARLDAYAATKPGAEALSEVFGGLVDETNEQRGEAIARLRQIARRQRTLTEATDTLTDKLRSQPANAPGRADLVASRALMVRQYEEVERTIRYACEIPVAMEARLGRFAQVLRRGLE